MAHDARPASSIKQKTGTGGGRNELKAQDLVVAPLLIDFISTWYFESKINVCEMNVIAADNNTGYSHPDMWRDQSEQQNR